MRPGTEPRKSVIQNRHVRMLPGMQAGGVGAEPAGAGVQENGNRGP